MAKFSVPKLYIFLNRKAWAAERFVKYKSDFRALRLLLAGKDPKMSVAQN